MSVTVKLIVELPTDKYLAVKTNMINDFIYDAVKHGIPLDDVKAEIAEEICLTDNPYSGETKYTIEHSKLLEILDSIGKGAT